MAVLDTGYSGFLLIPYKIFRRFEFQKLKTKSVKATLADGSSFDINASFGSIYFPSLNGLTIDGLIETSEGASEILIWDGGDQKLNFGARLLFEEINSRSVQMNTCKNGNLWRAKIA